MTANMPFPVMFAFFYSLFQRFWLLCRDDERGRYNMNEFHYRQDRIFKKLIAEYKQFWWNDAELDWVCGKMERNNSMLDPFHFAEGSFVYCPWSKLLFSKSIKKYGQFGFISIV